MNRSRTMLSTRRNFLSTILALPAVGWAGNDQRPQPASECDADLPEDEPPHSWHYAPRWPVWASDHPLARRLIRAARSGESLLLVYRGGSTPGAARQYSPCFLFQIEGRDSLYVSGYCHHRQRSRTLRLDRIECPGT